MGQVKQTTNFESTTLLVLIVIMVYTRSQKQTMKQLKQNLSSASNQINVSQNARDSSHQQQKEKVTGVLSVSVVHLYPVTSFCIGLVSSFLLLLRTHFVVLFGGWGWGGWVWGRGDWLLFPFD